MKKRIKFLTNKEFVARYDKNLIRPHCYGGVEGCPSDYNLVDLPYCDDMFSEDICNLCWNQKVQFKGKYFGVIECTNKSKKS